MGLGVAQACGEKGEAGKGLGVKARASGLPVLPVGTWVGTERGRNVVLIFTLAASRDPGRDPMFGWRRRAEQDSGESPVVGRAGLGAFPALGGAWA